MRLGYSLPAVAALLAAPTALCAQQRAARPIPVRQLTSTVATDSNVLSGVTGVRHLSDGRVIVNDDIRHRLLIFDSTLAHFSVIADTAAGASNRYASLFNVIISYRGDSTVWVDREAGALVVIDQNGRFVRTIAPVHPADLIYMTQVAYGNPGFDPTGRLVYRTTRRRSLAAPPPAPAATKAHSIIVQPDSAPILRSDFDLRTVDTIALMRIPTKRLKVLPSPVGSLALSDLYDPLPISDEWTLLPDGTVAIVRGQDYHIDWVHPDGRVTSTPKMEIAWKRITLEEKQHIVDSVTAFFRAVEATFPPPAPPPPGRDPMPRRPMETVDPANLPDYYPPVRRGQVRSDNDGNVWILPATSTLAGDALVFDVVARDGAVVERVRLLPGRTLAGFGPAGIVYMTRQSPNGGAFLERARVVR